jgi:hypothetical protein
MKTTYLILIHKNCEPLPVEFFKMNIFDKPILTNKFNEAVELIENGEAVEYMKFDSISFYPAMLFVEKEKNKIFTISKSGYKKSYHIKKQRS